MHLDEYRSTIDGKSAPPPPANGMAVMIGMLVFCLSFVTLYLTLPILGMGGLLTGAGLATLIFVCYHTIKTRRKAKQLEQQRQKQMAAQRSGL